MKIPGVIISGTTSGVGKTTIVMAIIHGLQKKGYIVQPFKIGPDYIDPSYHNAIAKKSSKNLDVWLMGKQGIFESFFNTTKDSEFAVLEGVMGLFDGLSGKNNYASTAHISEILNVPIILVVDTRKAARSLAAITLGFIKFDKKIKIAGVILNHISSERHLKYITEAFQSKIKVPIIGKIFSNRNNFQERHLGLVPTRELSINNINDIIKNAKEISRSVDIEKVIEIGYINKNNLEERVQSEGNNGNEFNRKKIKISIALDKSFNFYYKDNLEILQKKATIEFFSPIDNTSLPPDTMGIIIGGGFPEIIADELEKNTSIKKNILKLAQDNIPLYAECGGLMYLTRSISGYRNKKRKYKMVGLFDAETIMTGKLILGYTEAVLNNNKSIFGNVKRIRGHEFHYSNIINNHKDLKLIYTLKKGKGIIDGYDGFYSNNSIASYMHTHFINSKISDNFIESCYKYSKK
ncbi:MAG TPA: cobyrinate a,c-diamide synthase [Candidatus Sulfopaludibacter sp.]|nr:cobyrinate a,c-diamide synthase [Candidatus Sulfopaludibacter sp.]